MIGKPFVAATSALALLAMTGAVYAGVRIAESE
jgi:hypothetical protein